MNGSATGFPKGWIRPVLLVSAGVVALAWSSSYFLRWERYHSDWEQSESVTTEEARWWFSNFGSLGFAWRFQEDRKGGIPTPPPDESRLSNHPGSPVALGHIHPEGAGAWHWFHFQPTKVKLMGSAKTEYGHLFLPYWILFLLLSAPLVGRCNGGKEHRVRPEKVPAG